MKKIILVLLFLTFTLTSCKINNINTDPSSNTTSKDDLSSSNITSNDFEFISQLKAMNLDDIYNQNAENSDQNSIAYKFGEWIIYYTSGSYNGPSKIIRMKSDGTEKSTIFNSDKCISNIFIYDKQTLLIEFMVNVQYEYSDFEYGLFDLSANKIIDNSELPQDIKEGKYNGLFISKDYLISSSSKLDDDDTGIYTIYYNRRGEKNFNLLKDNVKDYIISNDKLYYILDEQSKIFSCDFDGGNNKIVVDNISVEYFNILENKLLYETIGYLNIYDLTNKSIEKLSGIKDKIYAYNVFQMCSDGDYYYTFHSDRGLVKISIDGKSEVTLLENKIIRSISTLDDWVYFNNVYYDDGGLTTKFQLYRIRKDGSDLQLLS